MIKNKQMIFVIGISFIQVLFFLLPFIIRDSFPKYYAGDPNFDPDKFHTEYGPSILPPKVLPQNIARISFQIPIIGFLWGIVWSIFTYYKRNTFVAYKIIILSFISYAAVTFLFYGLAILDGAGHG